MNLGKHATKPLALLAELFEELGVQFSNLYIEGDAEAIGVNLLAEVFPDAAALVQPEEDHEVAWLGYESADGGRLAAHFFCCEASFLAVLRCFERAKEAGSIYGSVERCAGEWCVLVSLPADESKGDKEWFKSVIDVANGPQTLVE